MTKRTSSDNYDLDLVIAEANGITIDCVDLMPLEVVEDLREHYWQQNWQFFYGEGKSNVKI